MKHLFREAMLWAAAAFLLAGSQAFGQAGTKPAAQKPNALGDQTSQASNKDLNIRAYIELLRSDVKSQATAIIAAVMQFDDAQAAKFWPIYREFEMDLSKIGDQKVALIVKYANNYQSMTDEVADQLALEAFKLEQARNDLIFRYYDRIKKALTAKDAARFVQVLNQILMITDLQVASELPVIK